VAQTLTAAAPLRGVYGRQEPDPRAERQPYDLLLLDWNMPEMPGDVVLQWVRKNLHHESAVLFLTSRSVEADIVQMLNAGADDYILKPCRGLCCSRAWKRCCGGLHAAARSDP